MNAELENYYFIRKVTHWIWDKDLGCDFAKYWAGHTGEEPLQISLDCSDLFLWACSDEQEITVDNFSILEKTYEDIKPLYEVEGHVCSIMLKILFCCRVRECRPQTPYYYRIDRKYWDLINECGEVRSDQMDVEEYITKKDKEKV